MKKLLTIALAALALSAALVSCKNKDGSQGAQSASPDPANSRVAGTYSRHNDPDFLMDTFSIDLRADGTCSYYETLISSYIGDCRYRVEGDTVIIEDEGIPSKNPRKHVFKFKFEDNKLVFIADGSDQFMYIKLEDGTVFDKAVVSSEEPNN